MLVCACLVVLVLVFVCVGVCVIDAPHAQMECPQRCISGVLTRECQFRIVFHSKAQNLLLLSKSGRE